MRAVLISTTLAVLSMALFLSGAPAKERGPHGKGARAFEHMDADGDGQISQSEFDQSHAKRFARWDRDGDGAVTKEEAHRRVARRFERIDGNGDGVIEESEFQAHSQEHFGKMDSDGDGQVSRGEFDEAIAQMRQRHGRQ